MHTREDFELLESLCVASDPLEDRLEGVLLEIHRHGDRYVLLEVAPATADRLLLRRGSPRRTGGWSGRSSPGSSGRAACRRRGPPQEPALVASYPVRGDADGRRVLRRLPGIDR